MDAPATWADGFGNWHARVPDGTPDPARAARAAIRAELKARDAIGAGFRLRVTQDQTDPAVFHEFVN